jgi:hypothetical protein
MEFLREAKAALLNANADREHAASCARSLEDKVRQEAELRLHHEQEFEKERAGLQQRVLDVARASECLSLSRSL